MKLKISGKLYDVEAGASKATLQTLLVMQRDYGINMPQLAAAAGRMQGITDPNQVLGDPELLQAFLVMVWLARRHAGEDMTLEESSNVPIDELELIVEDGDVQEPDPKEQTVSAADEEPPAEPATTSKTSKRRSTKTSPTSATTGQE